MPIHPERFDDRGWLRDVTRRAAQLGLDYKGGVTPEGYGLVLSRDDLGSPYRALLSRRNDYQSTQRPFHFDGYYVRWVGSATGKIRDDAPSWFLEIEDALEHVFKSFQAMDAAMRLGA